MYLEAERGHSREKVWEHVRKRGGRHMHEAEQQPAVQRRTLILAYLFRSALLLPAMSGAGA